MIRLPPRSPRTATLCPYTTRFPSLWAMGNDTGGIESTVRPPAVAPLGGNDEYATATPTSVNGRIAYAAQHFNGFHIRWTDHGKRVPLHIHTIQYHLHRLVK